MPGREEPGGEGGRGGRNFFAIAIDRINFFVVYFLGKGHVIALQVVIFSL